MTDWRIDPDRMQDKHCVDLMYQPEMGDEGELYCWKYASVKWDGCIHFHQAGNVPYQKSYGIANSINRDEAACDDYIHICDIEKMIESLTSLKKAAMEYFKNREDNYWKEKKQ